MCSKLYPRERTGASGREIRRTSDENDAHGSIQISVPHSGRAHPLAEFRKGYIPTLDGWRAIAIWAVLIDHLIADSYRYSHPTLYTITRVGPNGVSLFFAIS